MDCKLSGDVLFYRDAFDRIQNLTFFALFRPWTTINDLEPNFFRKLRKRALLWGHIETFIDKSFQE